MSAHQMLLMIEQLAYTDYTLVATTSSSNLNYPICQGPIRGYGPSQAGDSITPSTFRGITISELVTSDEYIIDDLLLACTFGFYQTRFTLASAPTQGVNFLKRIEFWNSTYTTKSAVLESSVATYSTGTWYWDNYNSITANGTYYIRIVYDPN